MVEDRDRLQQIISRVEGQVGVTLTSSASDMLVKPVMEQVAAGQHVEWSTVESSVKTIIEAAKPNVAPGGQADARAIIRAFHERWCDIPPFCWGRR
jgi:hypothetical protein